MKLLEFHSTILEKQLGNVDSNLENSQGILSVKRGKQVLRQKDNFDFIKYYIHFQNLETYQKELVHQMIETNHYAFDAKILAKFTMK